MKSCGSQASSARRVRERKKTSVCSNDELISTMTKIVYLVETPVDQRDFGRFGLSYWIGKGAEVSIVEVTRITRPHWDDPRGDVWNRHPEVDYQEIGPNSQPDLITTVAGNADLVFNLVGFTGSAAATNVYRALSRTSTPYVVLSLGATPTYSSNGNFAFVEKITRYARKIFGFNGSIIRSLRIRTPIRLLGIRPADYCVLGGSESRFDTRMYPLSSETEFIAAHSLDYERFRFERRDDIALSERYAVFVDENVGFHRDLIDLKIEIPFELQTYYANIRKLFARIERELHLPVVVALDPRAVKTDRCGFFGEAQTVSGYSHELISGSRLVIGHRSTALGIAALCGKPILLTAMKDYYDLPILHDSFMAFERALNRRFQFLDDCDHIDLNNVSPDPERYATYVNKYIKAENSPDKKLWDIVSERIGV